MKIIAFYKCWSGEEFLIPSILSIYKHVYKIVLLTSNVSWIGGKDNPSIEQIEKFKQEFDHERKIFHLEYDEPNQLKHCDYAYQWIKERWGNKIDFVQLIDSDEIWDDNNYKKAIECLRNNPKYLAYRTDMYTYIKSPYYRIEPPEPLKPVCFIKPNLKDMGNEPRGCALKPFFHMNGVYIHHYVFVRNHFNKVLEKLIQSHVSEKQPYEDMSKWIPQVWNNLPNIPESWTRHRGGFHPAIGYGRNWKNLKKITDNEIPQIIHHPQCEYIKNFGR
jgi:hypothetical protein